MKTDNVMNVIKLEEGKMKRKTRCPTHPGVLLGEVALPGLGLSVSRAAEHLSVSRAYLHRLLNGDVPMSMEMCVKVGKLAGNGARLWANMQAAHDLWKAEHDPAVQKAVKKIPSYAELMAG